MQLLLLLIHLICGSHVRLIMEALVGRQTLLNGQHA